MFDQWFKQDVEKVLARRDRVVVVDESAHFDLIKKVLPAGVTLFVVMGAWRNWSASTSSKNSTSTTRC